MIRPLKKEEFDTVIEIVNDNWKSVYAGYVAPELLEESGCAKRASELITDFNTKRLEEYVWEETGQTLALLSIGNTEDADKPSAFEIWRIYIALIAQGKGIGGQLLAFAEQRAIQKGYVEVVIWAFQENIRAIRFYQKYGYRIDKEVYLGSPYYAHGIRLMKKL